MQARPDSQSTNSSGQASYPITSSSAGTDVVRVRKEGSLADTSSTVTVQWLPEVISYTLILAPAASAKAITLGHTLTATLTSLSNMPGSTPQLVTDQTVTISVTSGPHVGKAQTAITNTSGPDGAYLYWCSRWA